MSITFGALIPFVLGFIALTWAEMAGLPGVTPALVCAGVTIVSMLAWLYSPLPFSSGFGASSSAGSWGFNRGDEQ